MHDGRRRVQKAVAWIVANQLGRRNITEEQKAYLRGRRYLEEKKEHGTNQHSGGEDTVSSPQKTYDKLGQEYGVTGRTIQRDAKFAQAVDALTAVGGEEVKQTGVRWWGRRRTRHDAPGITISA